MPSGSWKQIDVQCPFYKSDDGKKHITCEGFTDGSSVTLNYQKKQDYIQQIQLFCCQHYQKCEVHRMLMEKYED